MPSSYDYTNPGVAAADALETFLAERAIRKRQKMLDQMAQEQERRAAEKEKNDEIYRNELLDFQKVRHKHEVKAFETQAEDQRNDREVAKAKQIKGDMQKGDIPDASIVDLFKRTGMMGGIRIAPSAPQVGPMPEQPVVGPDPMGAEPGSVMEPGAEPGMTMEPERAEPYAGTAQQVAVRQFAEALKAGVDPKQAVAAYLQSNGDPEKIDSLITAMRGPAGGAITAGAFEDYVTRKEAETGRPMTPPEMLQARKDYQTVDDRPYPPIVIQTSEGFGVADRGSATVRPLTEGGDRVQAQDTAQMRNKKMARGELTKVLGPVKKLSKEIITKIGPAQRADALKRGAAAVFGSDPSFRTYQDARMAIAGNLAVAQQGSRPSNPDVERMWLPLVPDAYSDTAESADMKWKMVEAMQSVSDAATPAPGTGFKVLGSRPVAK